MLTGVGSISSAKKINAHVIKLIIYTLIKITVIILFLFVFFIFKLKPPTVFYMLQEALLLEEYHKVY